MVNATIQDISVSPKPCSLRHAIDSTDNLETNRGCPLFGQVNTTTTTVRLIHSVYDENTPPVASGSNIGKEKAAIGKLFLYISLRLQDLSAI